MPPRYSYSAFNALASNDTGHFVFLDAWSINACLSIMEQASTLWQWTNDQFPLTVSEIDDLQAKLAEVQYQLMTPLVGLIMPSAAATVPAGTLLCDGAIYLRADYPLLYAALDAAFIIDADSFAVPDLRDRFVLGDGVAHAVGDNGGSFEHTMTEAELVPHIHTTQPHSHAETGAVSTVINGGLEAPASAATPFPDVTGLATVDVDSTGGGDPMDITPPFLVLKYVMVAL